jgi:hypothetical protein
MPVDVQTGEVLFPSAAVEPWQYTAHVPFALE